MHAAVRPTLRCPSCRRDGTFDTVGTQDLQDALGPTLFGVRRCPNHACNIAVFVVIKGNQVVAAYPAEAIDFDASRIPPEIAASLAEAIVCYANECYRAAALMVRRTLEEICANQGATGKDLKARLDALRKTVILPNSLMDALHDVRLMGNDAAHVESKDYDSVGKEEAEVAIDFTKELLKAIFQLQSLKERFDKLKKPTP
jgi:hypothetical protein